MAADPGLHVLVIEDDADTCANLRDILELDDYAVDTAASAAAALGRADWSRYSAIILDRRLPDGTAEEVLPRLQRLAPHAAVIIVTGYADLQGAVSALRHRAADYILKPVNPDALRASLARIAEQRRLAQEKRRSEEALQRERDFAESLIETAQAVVLVLDLGGRVVRFNSYMKDLSGYPLDEVRGRDWFEHFLPERDRQALRAVFQETLAHGSSRRTNPIRTRDGRERAIEWSNKVLKDASGQTVGVLALGHDITELKNAQERALQAERLAAIGQMVAGLAHESGNALQRSQACLEMLALEVEDRPAALDLINRIQKAQDQLQQLYDDVRGYAAPLKLARETWNLSGIWREAWANLATHRAGKPAELHEEAAGVDLTCRVDNFRLGQVFRNILENSLTACKEPVHIWVTCAETDWQGQPAVRIAIRDNGPGLTPEQRQKIFDPFFTTKTKGTGLGMAIAKRIVEAHGGAIAVGTSPQPGAEIVLVLPRGNA